MTTIAWDGKIFAADSLVSIGNAKYYCTKIFPHIDQNGNRFLIGASGSNNVCNALIEWFKNSSDPDEFPKSSESKNNTDLLIIDSNNRAFLYDGSPYATEFYKEPIAIGSGADFARAAMHLGQSAPEAIEVSKKFDLYTGGNVVTLTFEDQYFEAAIKLAKEQEIKRREGIEKAKQFIDAFHNANQRKELAISQNLFNGTIDLSNTPNLPIR